MSSPPGALARLRWRLRWMFCDGGDNGGGAGANSGYARMLPAAGGHGPDEHWRRKSRLSRDPAGFRLVAMSAAGVRTVSRRVAPRARRRLEEEEEEVMPN